MNPLLRLYPKAWRDRYGDELERLLEDDPPGFLGTLDLVRGALDARMHASLVPATAGGGPASVPGDLPAIRRGFPLDAFLGTLAAGLFFVTAGAMAWAGLLSLRASWQIPSYLLILASVTLGLTVLRTTGRGVIAKLAGLAFLSAVIFFWWDGMYVPASYSVLAGGALLALGSLVEKQPPRSVGGLAAGMTLAWWVCHAATEYLPLAAVGFGIVAIGLVSSERAWIRPILLGSLVTGAVVLGVSGLVVATQPPVLSARYAVHCAEGMDEQDCLAQIETLERRFLAIRPEDTVTQGRITADGIVGICAVVTSYGDPTVFDDPDWVAQHRQEGSLGMHLISVSTMGGDLVRQSCWVAD